MRFIQDSSFTVKPDKIQAFQEWFVQNESRIRGAYPEGTAFLGVFVTVFGSNKESGDVHYLEQLDSYGALDRLAAEGKKPDSEYSLFLNELLSFVVPDLNAPGGVVLLKDLVDATVFDLPEAAKEQVPIPA